MNHSSEHHEHRDQTEFDSENFTSQASQEFHDFIADIEALFKISTSFSDEELAAVKQQFDEHVSAAKAHAEKITETLTQQACDSAAKANHYVHEQPWKAVAIGVAVGFLVGIFTRKK